MYRSKLRTTGERVGGPRQYQAARGRGTAQCTEGMDRYGVQRCTEGVCPGPCRPKPVSSARSTNNVRRDNAVGGTVGARSGTPRTTVYGGLGGQGANVQRCTAGLAETVKLYQRCTAGNSVRRVQLSVGTVGVRRVYGRWSVGVGSGWSLIITSWLRRPVSGWCLPARYGSPWPLGPGYHRIFC